MSGWELLIDEMELDSVLPGEYASYRKPVLGAIGVFLDGLPEDYRAQVLREQALLDPAEGASKRLATLARSCPVLHKLGQILARNRHLSFDLRRHLQQLESLPSSIPLSTIKDVLARELGPLDRLGISLLPPALAEASVSVVIPFWIDRESGKKGEGVFKVLKPGIEERLELELELLDSVGAYLDQRCSDFNIPKLDYREAFEQVRGKLRFEVRLDLEQRNIERARSFYGADPRVQIPALLDPSTPRVTAMERVFGRKVTESGLGSGPERDRLAGLVVDALLARPIFSKAHKAFFHGDPHAGNLFLANDRRLAILDWSLVGCLGERELITFVQIMLGALEFDVKRIMKSLGALCGERPVDGSALVSIVHSWLGRIRQGSFPGFYWLMGMIDEAAQRAGLRLGAELMFFRKTVLMLEGVVADIGAGKDLIDQMILKEFLFHLAREWPQRWLALPHSRAFATRLSNIDLTGLMLAFPWTAVRFWLDQGLDLLRLSESLSG